VILSTVTVELGEFIQVGGTVIDPVTSGEFTMAVAPAEAISSTESLLVLLLEAPVGGNGTRIVSKTGEILTELDILSDVRASVDGVLNITVDGTDITVTITENTSTSVMGGTFAADQSVDVYGECTTGGTFDAKQIVIFDDQRAY
jgi:hypothetical protein